MAILDITEKMEEVGSDHVQYSGMHLAMLSEDVHVIKKYWDKEEY
jgi:hypothetical protein